MDSIFIKEQAISSQSVGIVKQINLFFLDDTSLWYRSMKFGTDTLQGLLFREQACATQNSKMAPQNPRCLPKNVFFPF